MEVTFSVQVEQDDQPVRGNAMASGDPDLDREVENEIIERLDRGDVWAWACVTVKARAVNMPEGFEGTSSALGACVYDDEESFMTCPYFDDLKEEAIADLENKTAQIMRAVFDDTKPAQS